MIQSIFICLILWVIPILNVLCIYYIDKDKGETLKQYIVRNNIEIIAFMSVIPCLGMSCMLILILMFVTSKKYE
jgi:hypothetical protein